MRKRLLILGAGYFQVPFIMEAKRLGAYVGVVDINNASPGIQYADEYFCCSLIEKEKVLEIAEQFKAEGITVGTCETAVVTAAYIAEQMHLPFYSRDVANKATDKIAMIEAFFNNGVFAPQYEVYRPGNEKKTSIPYPVITKPADKSASKGIYFVESEDDLEKAIEISMAASDSKEILIEEYMDGPEISVELGVEGTEPVALQVTDKITNGAPHYVEIGQAQPADYSADIIEEAKKLACSAARAVGLSNCAGHAEIKITKTGLKMVEIGGRMGGHFIDAELLEYSSGYRLQEAIIRHALGEAFVLRRDEPVGPTAMKCFLSGNGKIKKISGVEKASGIPGIIKVVMACKEGKVYHQGVSNNDLIGFVVATASTEQEALAICDKAMETIVIEYE